jgi:putative ABC transport system substrate-binding protein
VLKPGSATYSPCTTDRAIGHANSVHIGVKAGFTAALARPCRQRVRTKRREFIIGSIALWTSTPSFAQKTTTRRIAIAHSSSPVGEIRIDGDNAFVNALFDELVKLGWIEGKNLAIGRFSANGRTGHFKIIAEEIVKSRPEVVVANTSAFVRSIKEMSAGIPIVGVTADPIAYDK